jgi:VWFA-related protein
MKSRRSHIVAAVLLTLAAVWTVRAQSQPGSPQTIPTPTFRAEVEYVEVDALATDGQGRFVRDLRKEEFQVLEDGRRQTITSFALVDIPAAPIDRMTQAGRGGVDLVDSDVHDNELPFIGRLYVLVLDDLHTAPLRAPLVRKAARDFIDRHLASNDLMAVVTTGGRSTGAQDFTSNKRLLGAAVDELIGLKVNSSTMTRNELFYAGGVSSVDGRVSDPFDMERGFNAQSTTRALRQVSEWLGSIRGRRKTIVLISEGIDYDITDVFNNRAASTVIDEMRTAIAAATRSNVTIYAVDPRGLVAYGDDAIETGQFADQRPRTALDGGDPGQLEPRVGIGPGGLRSELQLSQDSLRTIAEQTNGFAAVNTNDIAGAFERIVADNSTYYTLAYYPSSNKRDGKVHRIEVRTSRPGVQVRARRAYVAPTGKQPPPMPSIYGSSAVVTRALNSPLPVNGITIRVFAAPMKGTAANASVLLGVELRGSDLTFAANRKIELSYLAADTSGQARDGDTKQFTLNVAPDVKARLQKNGLRILNRMNLPPGRYQVRVAAHDEATGALGAVSYPLEVPDYDKLPLSLSGLVLSTKTGTETMTARGDPMLQKVLPAPPVALRTIPANDEIVAFAEIYDRAGAAVHTVDIVTTVKSTDGTVVFQHEDARSSSELQGASGGYGHLVRVPLSQISPGHYVLTVEARSRLGHTASRQVPFEVTAATQ